MSERVEQSILGPFAEPQVARAHFAARLAFETDPSDVAAAIAAGESIQLVDVRGRAAWDQGHAASAVHVPRAELLDRLDELDPARPIVVMCWGPACNGGVKAAHALAGAGLRVKELLGGFEYWAREGLPVESAAGHVHREVDPLTAPVAGGGTAPAATAAAARAVSCDC
ncbi:MAG: rhodanese-like domain-containing protein [Microcella sp.]|uniref:rhodanese-like domain-containing protein n=1 Tax=Microcella sp. TaxID=1913979 RepID=UPI00331493B4